MPANTRLIAGATALTAIIVVMASGAVALLDRASGASGKDPRESVTTLRAAIRTQWLSPTNARRSLEARSAALSDWLRARGGTLRLVSSSALLRTRAMDGSRLAVPEARFEHIIEIRVPQAVELARARLALLGPDGTVGIATPVESRAARHGTRARTVPVGRDF
ncbi:MAG TPA: hypothetical protein VEZ88_07670 [Steroidobacteraceae bacterium]|nr:hypothetical protein [Steroidobacteraceae bacterium]